MNRPVWDDARVSVVRRLQATVGTAVPGTETSEIAEHAIDLALSAARTETSPAFLFRNVWRNARHVLRRRHRRQPIIVDALDEFSLLGRQILAGEFPGSRIVHAPDAEAVAADLEQRIRIEVAQLSETAAGCLDGLLRGETVAESATRLRATPRQVRHMRSSIRQIARGLVADSRAA